jgi:hypothetical protein
MPDCIGNCNPVLGDDLDVDTFIKQIIVRPATIQNSQRNVLGPITELSNIGLKIRRCFHVDRVSNESIVAGVLWADFEMVSWQASINSLVNELASMLPLPRGKLEVCSSVFSGAGGVDAR